jgi:hypothetical protein
VVLIGVTATLMGLFVVSVGLGIVAPHPLRSHEAPPWLLVLLGTMFALVGVALVVGHLRGNVPAKIEDQTHDGRGGIRFLRLIFSLFMMGGFAALAAWVAFGSGPRTFRTNFSFLGGAAGEMIGRALFGAVAIALCMVLIVVAAAVLRRCAR